ncbi:MAG TPA: hypothetical protein VGC55_18790 [Dokdonella sp.]
MASAVVRVAFALAVSWVFTARAGTLEEDEAHMERVMQAERLAAAAKNQGHAGDTKRAPDGTASEPAPVAAVVFAPTPPSPNSDWLASEQTQNGGLSFGDLAQHVGSRVSIVTAGEHVHNGVVSAADARQVTLRVKRRGGQATYALPRNQIVSIALR